MRVVFDTNVLVSALNFPGGAPEAAYRLVLERRIDLVTSPTPLAELARVLADKFGWDGARVQDAISQVIRLATVLTPTRVVTEILEDPSDDRVLEAAEEGAVDAIVSGDRHLLKLGFWQDIRIIGPALLVEELES